MQTTIEETDKHTVKLTIEVDAERVGNDLDAAYRKVAKQVKIPGFRKGKVPRKVIDAQIGREAVLGEFLEDAVPSYYGEALREHELAPIAQPEIDLEQLEEGKALVFTAVVEVRPRLKLADSEYKGIEVTRPKTEATEAEVDELLESLRERFAELETVPRPARKGDYAVIDLRGHVHGDEVPEVTRPDHLYEIGSGEFAGKLDEEIEGKRAGEILKFVAPLDERYGERAGEEVAFQLLVKEVKGKKLPPVDDDLAKTASEFDTLEELRGSLREQIERNKERAADAAVRDRAIEAVVGRIEVDLPDRLVDEETEHRVAHAKERAEQLGMTLEQLLQMQGFDELRFRADARDHATRSIKIDLVLEAIARQEDLQVTAEELGQQISQLAAALGRDAKDVATSLDRSGQVVSLAGDIIRSKALDLLVEHATITPEGESDSEIEASEEPVGDPQESQSEEKS